MLKIQRKMNRNYKFSARVLAKRFIHYSIETGEAKRENKEVLNKKFV